jgi:hypothetical protein
MGFRHVKGKKTKKQFLLKLVFLLNEIYLYITTIRYLMIIKCKSWGQGKV